MIEFSTELETRVKDILVANTGVGTDPDNYVKTWDDHLHDETVDNMPYVVITTRTAEKAGESEIGSKYDLYTYTVHIYYLDIQTVYATGKLKRSNILSRMKKSLESNRRLNNLQSIDPDGVREYVYDANISAVLFDSSGQEEYYSFVSELYLNVYTATSNS